MNEHNIYPQAEGIISDTRFSKRDRVKKILALIDDRNSYHGYTLTGLAKLIDKMYQNI